jgi:hypothetical protein
MRSHHLNILFVIQVYLGSEVCSSVLEIVVLEFLLGTSQTSHCSMSASHVQIVFLLDVSAANIALRDVDVFVSKNFLLNHILQFYINTHSNTHAKPTNLTYHIQLP